MPDRQRSVLRITGMPGSGLSRFINEVGNLAALRGFAVLTLRELSVTTPYIRRAWRYPLQRSSFKSIPRAKAYAEMLNGCVAVEKKAGLVLLIDNLQRIDRATLVFLHDLYFASDLTHLAVVYSDDSAGAQITFLNEVERQKVIHLNPFTQYGVRLWLRHTLQWEAPQEFVTWLYNETDGFCNLAQAVELLVRETSCVRTRWLQPVAV